MDYTNFVNREDKLGFLRNTLSSKGFRLVPVWGRKRVGKTALLIEAIKKGMKRKKAIYFLANEAAEIENIRHFKEDATRALGDETIMDLSNDWEALFRYIASKGVTVVMDEFPYLITSNPSIPSIFQRIIDVHLANSGTKLILCGSSIRMMGSMVLDYKFRAGILPSSGRGGCHIV